jgi:hypothetical protein
MLSLKNKLIWMLPFVLVGCGSTPQVAYKPPQVPPLPAEIKPKQANLSERLSDLLLNSQQKATGQSTNSTPVSQPTTK